MKTVIIGAVAGGATAAARLRRLDEKAEIVVLERGGYVSFANCGLPYYIGERLLKKSSYYYRRQRAFTNATVSRLDCRTRSQVSTAKKSRSSYRIIRADASMRRSMIN